MVDDNKLDRKSIYDCHGISIDVVYHNAVGVPADTLVITLPEKRSMLTTRHGFKETDVICNCHVPRELWDFMHDESRCWQETYGQIMAEVLSEANRSIEDIAFLSTGIRQERVSVAEEVYDEYWVMAVTTAGVKTNAMRVGVDKASGIERNGKFEKIGTINNIILTNAILEAPALASSFITITEAKNVALQEIDIRSAYAPALLATGTGTDQIIVVSGLDYKYTYVGGHTKLGEMMAQAVTKSTIQAIRNSRGF